uniref:Ribosomal RNA-processing protein 8 n=1 Tax=Anopheles atroparvus TaxID=41427 RepID=A0AAG5DPA6_ANOAO
MSKLFSECAWEADLPSIGSSFSFSKKLGRVKLKEKKSEDSVRRGDNNKKLKEQNVGWSVLLPKKDETRNGDSDRKGPVSTNGDRNGKVTNGKNDNPKSKRKAPEDGYDRHSAVSTDKSDDKSSMKKRKSNDHLKRTKQEASKKCGNVEPAGSLRDKLVERLKGSRFRYINEQLYKTTGEEAKKLFQEDPESFVAYHEGYRHQIVQWSMNPLDRIIKNIRKLPRDTVVADFGCGEARLAESIPNQTYSLDLVAYNSSVIACDMSNTPLESNFVNVVVFCLSLMGTNLVDFLLEANRVLKVGGLLKIAEVSSRFDNVNEFVANVKKCGFELVNKDLTHKLFYFFNFKKERTVIKGSIKIQPFSLKPCLYKKR